MSLLRRLGLDWLVTTLACGAMFAAGYLKGAGW